MILAGPFQLGILCDSNLWVAHYRMFFHKKLEAVLEMCYMPREHAHTHSSFSTSVNTYLAMVWYSSRAAYP